MKQVELAQRLGISKSCLSMIKDIKHKKVAAIGFEPTTKKINRSVALVLGVD